MKRKVERNEMLSQTPKKHVRDGWEEASKAIAAAGDDELVLGEFANDDDADLVW